MIISKSGFFYAKYPCMKIFAKISENFVPNKILHIDHRLIISVIIFQAKV